jgi:DnaK suppressor protein
MPLYSAEHFRSILLKEREEILNRASFAVSSGEMVVDKLGDEGDLASAESSVAERARLMERRAHLLQKIEYALARLDEGTYFECEGCEEPLSQSRLLARPVASLCISCKEEQESRENHFA